MKEPSGAFTLGRAVPVALGVLLVGYLALWAGGWRVRAFMSGQTDLGSYFVPKYQFAADRIAEGALPQWNPFEFAGAPFLATVQPSVFYPPVRLAYAFLSAEQAYVALFFGHMVLGAIGTLLLARDLGLASWPAVFAAAWVTQPMWLVRIYDHPVLLTATTWAPLLLLTLRRLVRAPGARTAAALAVVAAFQTLSGYPPLVLATGYVLVLALAFFLADRRRMVQPAPVPRIVGALLGAAALAALLSAVQILPTLDLALLTDRAAETERTQAMLASLAATGDDMLLYMGLPPTTLAVTVGAAWDRFGPFLLVPAGLAVVLRPRSTTVWLLVCALVLTAGLPAWAYRHLPLSSFIRFGAEWLFLATFVVYLLAACGLDAVLATRRFSRRLAAPVTLALLALANLASWRQVDHRWLELDFGTPLPLPAAMRQCEPDDARFRSFWTFGHLRGSLMHERIRSPAGYEQSLLPRRTSVFQRALGIGNGIVVPAWAQSVANESELASRVALRCIVSPPAPALVAAGFEERPADGDRRHRVYVNHDARPRVRIEHMVRHAASPDEALALAREAPLTGVILEGPDAPGTSDGTCAGAGDDHATIARDEPEELHVRTRSDCPGYLVVADSHAPGWSATLDGEPTFIHLADFAFRAVAVPAGEHTVVFRYQAPGLRLGIALSLVGIALAATCLLRRPSRGAAGRGR